MSEKILKALYGSDKTPLKLGKLEIPCYVLEDGTRVFSGRGIQKAIGYESKSGQWMNNFCRTKGLKELFHAGENSIFDRLSNPINFRLKNAGGSQLKANGYEVTILIDICSAIIEANRAGDFDDKIMVYNADMIIRSVAKVGIIALVDEVTGYQHDREQHELQKLLKAYISEELLPWQNRFPDIYYQELFRLNKWDYTIKGINKRPSVIGTWTNRLIYEQLPNEVLNTLKSKTPKSKSGNRLNRFHQYLTSDVGEPHLAEQINRIVTVFKLSDNMKDMWENFKKLKSRSATQEEPPFEFDDKGHTK